jgi:hypothetical protein
MRNTSILDFRKNAILTRAIQPNKSNLSQAAARAILRFELAKPDRERLHELLAKNQDDLLTVDERDQLDDYLHIGLLLDLLQAKARAALRRPANRSSRTHG